MQYFIAYNDNRVTVCHNRNSMPKFTGTATLTPEASQQPLFRADAMDLVSQRIQHQPNAISRDGIGDRKHLWDERSPPVRTH